MNSPRSLLEVVPHYNDSLEQVMASRAAELDAVRADYFDPETGAFEGDLASVSDDFSDVFSTYGGAILATTKEVREIVLDLAPKDAKNALLQAERAYTLRHGYSRITRVADLVVVSALWAAFDNTTLRNSFAQTPNIADRYIGQFVAEPRRSAMHAALDFDLLDHAQPSGLYTSVAMIERYGYSKAELRLAIDHKVGYAARKAGLFEGVQIIKKTASTSATAAHLRAEYDPVIAERLPNLTYEQARTAIDLVTNPVLREKLTIKYQERLEAAVLSALDFGGAMDLIDWHCVGVEAKALLRHKAAVKWHSQQTYRLQDQQAGLEITQKQLDVIQDLPWYKRLVMARKAKGLRGSITRRIGTIEMAKASLEKLEAMINPKFLEEETVEQA